MKTFTLAICGGWGIRLQMLGAARLFAQMHGRKLRIVWDNDFPCSWGAFTDEPPGDMLLPNVDWRRQTESNPTLRRWHYGQEAWTHELGASDIPDLAFAAAWPPEGLMFSRTAVIDAVRPTVACGSAARVADVPVLPPGVVGVHVRKTRPTDTTPVPEYPIEWYIETMRATNADTFLLCTDAPEVRSIFKAEFKGRIRSTYFTTGRDTELGLLGDLAECLALARCPTIIGSVSSFTHFAALYGRSNLILQETPDVPWW